MTLPASNDVHFSVNGSNSAFSFLSFPYSVSSLVSNASVVMNLILSVELLGLLHSVLIDPTCKVPSSHSCSIGTEVSKTSPSPAAPLQPVVQPTFHLLQCYRVLRDDCFAERLGAEICHVLLSILRTLNIVGPDIILYPQVCHICVFPNDRFLVCRERVR